ncbi:MAG TPA: crossover junction endodeoxyribonuclease RuvC [Pyrinomonadaceae bacterium]|jgi:crossover junction endodeoxyribonuclease RuvC|nr:crossover junction endodeoxyribonuclease RuvC [Pyrinomonadaceae bacterium]
MIVLGIDPGSETTGWGVVEGDARRYRLVDFGTVKASPRERFAARLLKISDGVEEVIRRFEPDACAVEEAFYAVNVKTAIKLGQVRGCLLLAAERAGIVIGEYAPRLIKSTVVGYGGAEKHQVQEMVRVLLSMKQVPQPHDAADALAIAITHLHHTNLASRVERQSPPARARLEALLAASPRRRARR